MAGPDGFSMPATQHDLLVWIAVAERDRRFRRDEESVRVQQDQDVSEIAGHRICTDHDADARVTQPCDGAPSELAGKSP
jgi:hypothetical protein